MKKVVIFQKYLAPYRVPLFNNLSIHPEVDLTLLYYGKREARRIWKNFPEKKFKEVQSRCISLKRGYTQNFEIPLSLLNDLERLHPDIVFCAPDIGGIAAYIYSKRKSACYTIWSEATLTTEAMRNSSIIKRYIRNFLYKNAKNFVVPGNLAEIYIRNYWPPAKIFFAPNTINENDFIIGRDTLCNKFNSERLIITFSGSLVKDKGIILLIEAFNLLINQNPDLRNKCMLRVLGTGPLDLSRYADEYIEFPGFCEGGQYYQYFQQSHIFVLPSLHDCNPLTVIEALFSGNILIVSNAVGNHPEAIRDNGIVITVNSVDSIVHSLKTIIELPREELVRMASNSLNLAKNFSVERSVNGFQSAIFNDST